MEKVLVHDDDKDEIIHYIKDSFLESKKTLCGEKLYSINTIHIKKLDVTCIACKEKLKLRQNIKEIGSFEIDSSDIDTGEDINISINKTLSNKRLTADNVISISHIDEGPFYKIWYKY